jgi:hypothetical protein
LLSLRTPVAVRVIGVCLLASIGIYGTTLRISDVTHGVDVFRAEWQLVSGYRQAIENAGSRPLFIVDDAIGGEINSEAIQKFFGPQAHAVRVDDLSKDGDCPLLPDHGDPPVQIVVSARRLSPQSIFIRSVISGCGSHSFLGAAALPSGPIVRTAFGYRMTYRLDPRISPQLPSGAPRVLEVTLENVPSDTLIVCPDLVQRTYREVPIQE